MIKIMKQYFVALYKRGDVEPTFYLDEFSFTSFPSKIRSKLE